MVDTDAIARALTAPGGAAMPPSRAAFGADVDRRDRRAGPRPHARHGVCRPHRPSARLEAILHPLIGDRSAAPGRRRRAAPVIVFDVPLLVESGHWRARVDRVLVVDCRRSDADRAGDARSGWAASAVRAVIAAQATRAAARWRADAVICNDGDHTRPARRARSTRSGSAGTRPLPDERMRQPQPAVEQSRARHGPLRLRRIAILILYEYPFNESIRTMLRLEHLFDRLGQLIAARRAGRPPLRAGHASSRSWTWRRAPT